MSFRRRDGSVTIGPVSWKIPLGRSGVDNFGRGSLAAPIELSAGVAGRARHSLSDPDFASHPETGVRIEGVRIPHWQRLDPVMRAAFEVLPGLHGIGWDVAIAESGPLIIEANPWWGPRMLEVPPGRGLVQGEFANFLEDFGLEDLIRRRKLAVRLTELRKAAGKKQAEVEEWTARFMQAHRDLWPGWEGDAEIWRAFGPEDFAPPSS
jgi:hypothetical protein